MNSLAPRLNIDAEIAEIRARLQPVEKNQVAKAIVTMKSIGLQYPTGIDKEKVVPAFEIALRGLSHEALFKVVDKYIRGEFSAQSYGYMPTPTELAARVRDAEREDRAHIVRLIERRDSQTKDEKIIKTDEGKARVRATVAAVKRGTTEFLASQQMEKTR